MNQYIISDDELCEFKMLLEDMLDGEDHIDRLLEIVNIVCSRPYQSERDKVPNIFICPCPPNKNGFCTIPQNCIAKRMFDDEDGDIVCKAMRELRQSGEP